MREKWTKQLASAPADSALGRMRTAAEQLMAKDRSLSFAAALDRALSEDPELYTAYLEGR